MGFDDINPYIIGRFDSIKEKLNAVKDQDIYYQKWMSNYSKIFKTSTDLNVIEWKVREWRAIKEIYASAIFYKESEFSLENRCMASYYFSAYYSIFHAMLSAICFDTNITLNQISDINHSKVGNQFKNTYCHGKNSILSENIYDFFNKAKYLREYYSYTPPLNMSFYDSSYIENLQQFLIQCFQLTNLQSLILEKSNKHGCSRKIETKQQYSHVLQSFNKLVSKPNIDDNSKYILDPADFNVRDDILNCGIDFQFVAIQLDHIFDEFRLYSNSTKFFDSDDGIQASSINAFIYNSIK